MHKKKETLLKHLRKNTISGHEFCEKHSRLMDAHIKTLTEKLIPQNTAIIATGGYGRAELCPASDIDILFLVPKQASKTLEKNIEKFLYKIWDSGIKIGHAVRNIEDCRRVTAEDQKALTTLLDARLICGNAALFEDLQKTLQKQRGKRQKKSYVKAKLEERDARHTRLGDTRYMLEPNIKEGKGSLRDYQTLFWIAEIIYAAKTPQALQDLKILTKKEAQRFEKAYDFLLTVRCHLHDIAGRGEERLHFDIQPRLAKRLGYTQRNNAKAVERFMKHYFLVTRDIGDLTRIIIAAIEEAEDKRTKLITLPPKQYLGFEITADRLNFTKTQNLKDHPIDILRFFRIAQDSQIDIHPEALKKITRNRTLIDQTLQENKQANQIFLEILTDTKDAALTLRRMNEAGVLERFIPEFQKIIALMQFDRYHTFTVDEHTLRAIDILHGIESGTHKDKAPLASALIQDITQRRALYVAMFLHDICKGREKKAKGQDHSQLGAELALKLCPRLGLTDHETRLVSWLIFDHLFMADIAFKRDLEDPQTLDDFLFRIHDTERLKLLTILTTADIMAVGPGRFTSWKEKLLSDLYLLANNHLTGADNAAPPPTITLPENWDMQTPHIDITQDTERDATTVRIFTRDRRGLFANISGALATSNVSIIEARIHTLDNDCAADTFTVQNLSGKPIAKPHRHKDITSKILKAIDDNLDIDAAIKKHIKTLKTKDLVFDVPTGININNKASTACTCIEIYGRDRPALLYELANTLKKHNLQIITAKINTLGLKAIDVFYVKDQSGKKITTPEHLKKITKSLQKIIK